MDAFPPEILSKIFRTSCPTESFVDEPVQTAQDRSILHGVSRKWRAVGHADALLWSGVLVCDRMHLENISSHIGRTHATPVAIFIDLVAPRTRAILLLDRIMPLLDPLFRRCFSLRIATVHVDVTRAVINALATTAVPIMYNLHLELCTPSTLQQDHAMQTGQGLIPIPFSGFIPRLTRFTVARGLILWGAAPYYHTLRSVHLSYLHHMMEISLDQFFLFFKSTPLLERLHLSRLGCGRVRDARISAPSLVHLTHLEFGEISRTAISILEKMYLPNVRTLHWFVELGGYVDEVIEDCRTLFRGITTAVLDLDTRVPSHLPRILQAMPNIRRLDLRKTDTVDFLAETFRSFTMRSNLPSSLAFVLLNKTFPPDIILAMVMRASERSEQFNLQLPNGPYHFLQYYQVSGALLQRLGRDEDFWMDETVWKVV